ncbi:MAG: penicillin-binding transpeptidase domain-containing protein [Marmoricola sp.]
MRAVAIATVISVGGLGTLTACSSGPDPRPVADALAMALAAGNLSKAPLTTPAADQKQFATVIAGMNGAAHRVTVTNVSTSGDKATATLAWRWSVGSTTWRYSTTMNLTRSNADKRPWIGVWNAAAVAPGLTSTDRLTLNRVPATRGRILDASGNVLVGPRPVFQVGLDKTHVSAAKAPASATALAKVVGIDAKSFTNLVKASGPEAFVPAITFRANEFSASLRARISAVVGAVSVQGTLPLAPTKAFAGGLLGTVGQATADSVKQSKGRVLPGDTVGTSGLELRYDALLSGTPAATVQAVGAKATKTLFRSPAVPGKDLRLTLNLRLVNLADRILANVGPASALVAIQPSTGKVLAVSDGPGSNGYQNATIGQFAPGSTFKTVTSLALLRSGLTPQSRVPCTNSITIDGRKFVNDSFYPPSGLGSIPLTLALANSCNTAYLSQHARLKPGVLAAAAAALGFGVDEQTGYGSFFGQVPTPKGEVNAAADMIGQGTILASPLAMATVLSSVVAGHAVVPSLIQGLALPPRKPAQPLTAKEARELRSMLRAVVTTPTGTGAGLAGLPGPPIIAKTGTAEFQNGSKISTHAWMMAAQGDLVAIVFVNVGQTGAGVAGPLLAQFLRGARG